MGRRPFSCHDGPVTTPPTAVPTTAPVRGPLRRSTDGRLVAGVSSGIAAHLGVDVWVVRTAFVLLAFAKGAGIVAYGALWVLVPQAGELDEVGTNARTNGDRTWRLGPLLRWPRSPSVSSCSPSGSASASRAGSPCRCSSSGS